MNKLTIIGNLTRDPETRSVNGQNGPVSLCDFTVAVNRKRTGGNGQQEADYFRVTAWRGLGESCAQYLAKGRKVCVIGPVNCRTYTGSDGVTRASMEVAAEEVEFLTPKPDRSQGTQTSASHASRSTSPAQEQTSMPMPPPDRAPAGSVYVPVSDEDDMPF